jgi:hypothetical protein
MTDWRLIFSYHSGVPQRGACRWACRNFEAAMFLNYFALGVLIFVFLVIFYGIIILHDIPYLIAKSRNHPHADAIHVAGWVSLFTLHVIWPFLWIWATLYRPERGWGMQAEHESLIQLQRRVSELEQKLADTQRPPAE